MGGGMQAQSMMPMQGMGGGGGMMGGSMMQGGMQAQSMMPMGGGMGMSGMQMGGGVTPLSPEQAKSHRPRIGPSPGSQAAAPAQPAAEPDMVLSAPLLLSPLSTPAPNHPGASPDAAARAPCIGNLHRSPGARLPAQDGLGALVGGMMSSAKAKPKV